jgi:hypothetical protein
VPFVRRASEAETGRYREAILVKTHEVLCFAADLFDRRQGRRIEFDNQAGFDHEVS